jgi:uncharacterized membrane protein (GlpM family)
MYYDLLIRFGIGGAVIAGTTWIAEFFDPKFGGIIATIPSATIVSLLIVGNAVGEKAAIDFAKGIVLGNIPWFAYIFAVILLTQRIGLAKSLAVGLLIWFLLVPVASRLSQMV